MKIKVNYDNLDTWIEVTETNPYLKLIVNITSEAQKIINELKKAIEWQKEDKF